jgi:hypothetical protein
MPSTAIDSLLALLGRSNTLQPQNQNQVRMSDVDLARIQGAALEQGDRGKADRVTDIREMRNQVEQQEAAQAVDARLRAELLNRGQQPEPRRRASLLQRLAQPRNRLEADLIPGRDATPLR